MVMTSPIGQARQQANKSGIIYFPQTKKGPMRVETRRPESAFSGNGNLKLAAFEEAVTKATSGFNVMNFLVSFVNQTAKRNNMQLISAPVPSLEVTKRSLETNLKMTDNFTPEFNSLVRRFMIEDRKLNEAANNSKFPHSMKPELKDFLVMRILKTFVYANDEMTELQSEPNYKKALSKINQLAKYPTEQVIV
jgi:hypothetical protein